jgi:hypothetical protein
MRTEGRTARRGVTSDPTSSTAVLEPRHLRCHRSAVIAVQGRDVRIATDRDHFMLLSGNKSLPDAVLHRSMA